MRVFWIVVICIFIAAAVTPGLAYQPGPLSGPLMPAIRLAYYLTGGTLVALIWTIAFRAQVEKLHVSLWAIFVLILLEASFLLAIRAAKPFWAF